MALPPDLDKELRQVIRNSQSSPRATLNATCLLSFLVDRPLELDAESGMRVCSSIVTMAPRQQLTRYLQNAAESLVSPLRSTFSEGPLDRANNAAEWLLVLAPHDIDILVSVAVERDDPTLWAYGKVAPRFFEDWAKLLSESSTATCRCSHRTRRLNQKKKLPWPASYEQPPA